MKCQICKKKTKKPAYRKGKVLCQRCDDQHRPLRKPLRVWAEKMGYWKFM